MPIKPISPSIICILLFFLIHANGYAQTFQWAKHIGGAGWDEATAITIDSSGNVYCTGYFKGTVDFDPGPGVFLLTAGGTQAQDVFISKFDESGSFIWAKQIGVTGWQESYGIAIDDLGSIYTTGFFLGATNFDPTGTNFILNSSPGGDAFVCKHDSAGNFVWARQLGGTLALSSYSIAVDRSGYVYTTGFFDGTADFDPGISTYYMSVVGYSDIFICKLDTAGNFVWAKQLGGADGAIGHSIAVDTSGCVYTTGTFFGTVDFDPGSGTFYLHSPGEQEIFISKLDASGDFVWAKQMGGETGYSLVVDNKSNVLATGYYGWDDITINKLGPSGNIIWSKEIGAFMGRSIAVDDSNNVYTTGQFNGTRDFDPGPGIHDLTAIGSTDSYISKLDSSGNFLWVRQLGGTDEVQSRALTVFGSDNVFTAGSFNGTADFDPAITSYNLTAFGSYDIFLQKMMPGSTLISENTLPLVFNVYPNPSAGNLTIEFEKEHSTIDIVLRNILGQEVDKKSVKNSSRVEMHIGEESGIYLLEISLPNQPRTLVRIIKE